jgi:hypothetical protein
VVQVAAVHAELARGGGPRSVVALQRDYGAAAILQRFEQRFRALWGSSCSCCESSAARSLGVKERCATRSESGLRYARSAEFLQSPILERLRWMRMLGDTVFLSGVAALAWFVAGLWTGRSLAKPVPAAPPAPARKRELVLEEVA